MKSIKKFKVGDKVKTNQDYFQEYEGTVIEIETKPHPYRSSDKNLTWLRISYPFRKGSFSTCSTSVFN